MHDMVHKNYPLIQQVPIVLNQNSEKPIKLTMYIYAWLNVKSFLLNTRGINIYVLFIKAMAYTCMIKQLI